MMYGWDYIENIFDVIEILFDPARHFLYSAIAGLLVYLLTLTILSVLGWVWEHLTSKHISTVVVYIIILSSLLLATSAALGLHYVLDYVWLAYTTPLNPPLDLVVPSESSIRLLLNI